LYTKPVKGKRRNELKNEWKEKSPPGGGGERNITIDRACPKTRNFPSFFVGI